MHEHLEAKGLNDEFIDQTIRRANGLEGFSLYICHSAIHCQCAETSWYRGIQLLHNLPLFAMVLPTLVRFLPQRKPLVR